MLKRKLYQRKYYLYNIHRKKTYTLPSLGLLKSESPKPLSDSDSSDSFLFIRN